MKNITFLPLIILIHLFSMGYGQPPGRETLAPSSPDSVITYKFDAQGDSTLNAKMTYRYDNHLRVIESEKFVREQSLNLWIPNRKEVREYDNHDRRTLWAIYEWDNNEMAYKGWMKETTMYDNNGNQAEYHYFTWDYTSYDWGNRFWDLFDYDNENKLTRRDHLEWNTVSEYWDTASYEIYEYSGSGFLEYLTTYEPDEGSGIIYPSDRGDYEYDEFGNVFKITHQIYNPNTEQWYWSIRFQYNYDEQNRKNHSVYSLYDEQGEMWVEEEKEDWGWDDNDSLTIYAYYRIGEDLVTWYPNLKTEMTYNNRGRLIHYRGYSGNDQAQWVPTYERRYPYQNDTLLMADSLFQWIEDDQVWEFVDCHNYRYDSLFRMHTDSYYKLVVNTGEYLLSFRDYYFYSESSGIEEHEEGEKVKRESVEVYPNPTHGKFQISSTKFQTNPKFQAPSPKHQTNSKNQIQKIEVVDLSGKEVRISPLHRMGEGSGGGAGTLEFDLTGCPAGIYFLRINLENQTIVKKIIKL